MPGRGDQIGSRTWRLGRERGKSFKTPLTNLFIECQGREYGRWIDHQKAADASKNRTMGDVEGDLIECPVYIIESILRDELFVERDLRMTSSADTTHFIGLGSVGVGAVLSRTDDYYNYAELYQAGNTAARANVTDYVGSTAGFVTTAATGMTSGVNYFLTNIRGDYKIDYATFDVIGNTTDGKRKDWKFARSINTKQSIQALINELLFESHCIMFEAADEDTGESQIKIKALDKASVTEYGTLATPLKATETGKVEQVSCSLTPLANVYTSFELFYHYDYGKGDYTKRILVDKNGYSNPSGGTTLTDEHQNLCKFAEDTYRISNPFTYASNWIYDDATAEFFLDKKVRWFTEQRLKVKWTTQLAAVLYEVGDQGFISYNHGLPEEYKYQGTTAESHKFMITGKNIVTNPQGTPHIIFDLIDMGV